MKNTRFLFILLLSLFVIGCHTSSRPPMKNIFSFNFQEGKTYEYDVAWDFDHSIMGVSTEMKFNSVYLLGVEQTDGFEKTLTGEYRHFKMNVKAMGVELNIDTEKPMPPTDTLDNMSFVKRAFYAIIGKPFKMIVDEKGELLSVKGLDKILETMADSMGMENEMKAFAVASLKDQFNNEAVRDQFIQLFAIFPNKTVKVGDTWDKSYAFFGKFPARFATTYTVKDIEGDLVTLDVKSRIDSDEDFGITGEQTGTVIADSRWGLVVSADFKQDMAIKNKEMLMELKGTGQIRGKEVGSRK